MKKLLYICSGEDNIIDECLMIVEDGYVKKDVLERAEEMGIGEPYVLSEIELDVEAFVRLPATERPYVG